MRRTGSYLTCSCSLSVTMMTPEFVALVQSCNEPGHHRLQALIIVSVTLASVDLSGDCLDLAHRRCGAMADGYEDIETLVFARVG